MVIARVINGVYYELDKTNAFVAHADEMLTTVNVLSVVDRGVIKKHLSCIIKPHVKGEFYE